MRLYLFCFVILLFSVQVFAQNHLDIAVPALKDTDLKGPVKSEDVKTSINVSGKFEREHREYDEVGNLLSQTEWSPEGTRVNAMTNYYGAGGNFERHLYMDFEKGYTNDWEVILNPETRQIAMKKKANGAACIYTYSAAGYLLNYRYLDEDKKLQAGSVTKRGENNRKGEYTRIDGSKKPLYTYWFRWKEGGLIDRERQKYQQEKGERLHVYDYLKFDDYGNWTQRLMVRYDIGGKERKKVYERLVVRDLEYFNEEEPVRSKSDPEEPIDDGTLSAIDQLETVLSSDPPSGKNADEKNGEKKEDVTTPVSEMLATGRSQEELRATFDYTFGDISDKLVIINCSGEGGRSAGSGFIAKMNGKTYLFTNQHVIMGAETIRMRTANGETISPKSVELSSKRDIARILIDDRPAFTVSERFSLGSPLGIFGNSEGAGVATELFGEVTGLGVDLVEVNAEFVSGNSGSPVLNTKQEVIGIASYVRVTWTPPKTGEKESTSDSKKSDAEKKGDDEEDEDNKPTTKTRRFCYRLDDLKWQPVKWRDYNRKYGNLYKNSEAVATSVFDMISVWSDSPLEKIPESDDLSRDLAGWVKKHNDIIDRFKRRKYEKKSFINAYSESLEMLSKTCSDRSRRIAMFSKQRELSGFLQEEFKKNSYSLEYAGRYIQATADHIKDY